MSRGPEQAHSGAQPISRYVVDDVAHHYHAKHERQQGGRHGRGVGIWWQMPGVAPPLRQFDDVLEGVDIKLAGPVVQDGIPQCPRPCLQRQPGHVVLGVVGSAVQLRHKEG